MGKYPYPLKPCHIDYLPFSLAITSQRKRVPWHVKYYDLYIECINICNWGDSLVRWRTTWQPNWPRTPAFFPVLWSALWFNPGNLLVKMRDQDHPVQSDLSSASVPLTLPTLHVCIARYRTSPHGLDLVVSAHCCTRSHRATEELLKSKNINRSME